MTRSPDVTGAVARWLEEAGKALAAVDPLAMAAAARVLLDVRARGGTIFTAGNGGSAATASHLALDLQKAATTRAIALSDNVGLITAWANDTEFERVYAEQLKTQSRPGDAVVVISVSGSSPNIVVLLEAARDLGLATVGLLGRDGGEARALVDVAVVVPSDDYGWVETAHVALHHVLAYALRDGAVDAATSAPPLRRIAGD
jgi:D-sedoheptulose 7-phosphate isomerase